MARNPRRPAYFMGSTPKATRAKSYASAGGGQPPAWAAGTGWGYSQPWQPTGPNANMGLETEGGPSWMNVGGQRFLADFPYAEDVPNVNNPAGGRAPFIDVGAYMPDYMGNIEGDWEYTSALADMNEANKMDEAGMREALKSLAIGYGGDLSKLIQQGLIDQGTADLASKNEFSTMKELGRALERGTQRADSALAARGGLDSGARGALRSQLNENYQRQSTSAANDLLAQITGAQRGYAQNVAQRRMGLNQVKANVTNRLFQQAMSQSRAATRARWNPDMNAYEALDGSGRFYNADGTPAWG